MAQQQPQQPQPPHAPRPSLHKMHAATTAHFAASSSSGASLGIAPAARAQSGVLLGAQGKECEEKQREMEMHQTAFAANRDM